MSDRGDTPGVYEDNGEEQREDYLDDAPAVVAHGVEEGDVEGDDYEGEHEDDDEDGEYDNSGVQYDVGEDDEDDDEDGDYDEGAAQPAPQNSLTALLLGDPNADIDDDDDYDDDDDEDDEDEVEEVTPPALPAVKKRSIDELEAEDIPQVGKKAKA